MTAYDELLSDRSSVGFDIGSIPWSSIERWAQVHGLRDPDSIALIVYHIRALEKAARDFETAEKGEKEK